MPAGDHPPSVEVVRDRLDPGRAPAVRDLLATHGGVDPATAAARLGDVVSLALDDKGRPCGALTAVATPVARLGGQAMWLLETATADPALRRPLVRSAHTALAAEHDPDDVARPQGVVRLIDDAAELTAHPEAVWHDPWMLYAGHLPDGRQLRIGWFPGARLGTQGHSLERLERPRDVAEGYRVAAFDDEEHVSLDDIVALWTRDSVLPDAEARRRRAAEVLLVALAPDGTLAGVSTAYLARQPQLGLPLWHQRAYVAAAHRGAKLGFAFALEAPPLLRRRWDAGDRRGLGIVFEVQNALLERVLDHAHWVVVDRTFVALTDRGARVRVQYFPGARVPEPEPEDLA